MTWAEGILTHVEARRLRKAEGARVRAFRVSQGWTQAELAAHIGVTGNTVARWERGLIQISHRTFAQLTALNGGQAV